MRRAAVVTIVGLCISVPAFAQSAREQAADAAEELSEGTVSAPQDLGSEAGAEMQAIFAQMGSVATALEGALREGKSREQTEPLYQELRKLRLEAIGLASSGKAPLPDGAQELEARLQQLERYQHPK